jgi:predicted nucleic acid-binding protein
LTNSPKTSLIIIDWKGEYASLPMATVIRKVDFWNIPGESPREKALAAVEMLREISRDVVEITPASSLLLLKILEEEYRRGVPTTEKVLKVLERSAEIAQRDHQYAEANMYLALARRLYLLLVDEERKDENVTGDPRVVIYDLGSLTSVHLKILYANYILFKIYREAVKRNSNELKTLLIVEESQNYIHRRRSEEPPSLAERCVFELRSFGVGVVLVCPDPELLPQGILKDVGAIISLSPDTLPKFALERFLFRASLEEAEKTLKALKKAKMVIYHKGDFHYFRRLPKPPKVLRLKARPKGDRMGVTLPLMSSPPSHRRGAGVVASMANPPLPVSRQTNAKGRGEGGG